MERFTEVAMGILLIVVFITAAMWGVGMAFSTWFLKTGTGVLILGMLGVFGTVALVCAAMFLVLPAVSAAWNMHQKTQKPKF